MSSIRVVHVYKDYAPVYGGIEGHLRLLAEAQAAHGLEVTVLTTAPRGPTTESLEAGVRVVRARRLATVASMPLSLELVWRLPRLAADLVHVHMPYPVAELTALSLRRSRPLVVTYHADVVRQRLLERFVRPARRAFLRRAAAVAATSVAYARSSPMLRRVSDRLEVVPLGIDIERFADARPAPAPFPPGRPLVLFVGRFRHYKGLATLVRALPEVDANLLLIGDGPERSAIERQVRRSPVRDRVRLLGDVSDAALPGYYAAADLFVLPSVLRSEAYGLALVEAMASGTAVISTELGTGTSEVNEHGVTGLVVPLADAPALAVAMRQLLEDPVARQRLATTGAARARERYTSEQMVDSLLSLYERALGGQIARDQC